MNGKSTQISGEAYMRQVQRILLDAHIRPQHFAEALGLVAEHMSAETAFLWMPKRDSEMKNWYFSSGPHPFLEDMNFRIKYPELYDAMNQNGGLFLPNTTALLQTCPTEGETIAALGISSLALYPVYWVNGKTAFLLGAMNFTDCGSTVALEQVSLSFLMAMNHYENYHALTKMGKIDTMTGLMNRNSYQLALVELRQSAPQSIGCVYIDVNGLHEINNYLGHHAGDDMLRTVAKVLQWHFDSKETFRVGGDEFVLLCQNWELGALHRAMELVRQELLRSNYEISFGIAWSEGQYQIEDVVNDAENKMRVDKQTYYDKGGTTRNLNHINKQLEKLLNEKHDADLFLAVLRPEFKGVYFVDLDSDTVRHIFIPEYFEEVLSEVGDIFSDALLEYARRYVRDEYISQFEQVCAYDLLREKLDKNELPGFVYQKKDGDYLRLNIVKLQSDNERKYRTLWTFSDPEMTKI